MVNKKERLLLTIAIVLSIVLVISLINNFKEPLYLTKEPSEIAIMVNGELYSDDLIEINYDTNHLSIDIKTSNHNNYIEWYTTEFDYAIINLTPNTHMNYSYIFEDVENVISSIENFFGEPLRHQIPVYIHSGESYLVGHRFASYSFNMKHGTLSNEAIVINVEDFGELEQVDLRFIFAHELTHAFMHHVYSFNSIDENWFHEGMAEYVARHHVDYRDLPIQQKYGINLNHRDYIDGLQYLKHFTFNFDPNEVIIFKDVEMFDDYFIYDSIIYFLYENYEEQQFFKFIDEFSKLSTTNNPRNTDYIFKHVFGISEQEMVENWKAYYRLN